MKSTLYKLPFSVAEKRSTKKLMYAILLSIFFHTVNAQLTNLVWAKQMGGAGNETGKSVMTDGSGNIYTIGNFNGTVDFDPGTSVYNLTSSGGTNIFISKLDASGNFIWAKQFSGLIINIGQEKSFGIDGTGSVFITGYFNGTIDCDPGAGIVNLTSISNLNGFIIKLDASGNFIWAKLLEGLAYVVPMTICIDQSGNSYIGGYLDGTGDFDPGSGVFNLTSSAGSDIFILKLDNTGGFIWAKQFAGSGNEYATSITVDYSGFVYSTGYFQGTVDFDPGVGTYNLSSLGSSDVFTAKLDGAGNFVWAKQFGGANNENSSSVAVDMSGNIYCTGFFYGTTDFDPGVGTFNLTSAGSADIFISKLNTSGNFVWAKQIGGINYETGNSIASDANGNLYVTGGFNSTVDFDPNYGTYNLTSTGGLDAFITKLDASGSFIWSEQFGGINDEVAYGVVTDVSGKVYTTGYFQSTCDFDQGVGTYNLTSFGSSDIFIHKLSQTPITQLSSGSCGLTETSLDDYLYCDYVPGATDYKFEITDPNNNVTVYYRGTSSYVFLMSWVPGIGYGVTYNIRVSAQVGGNWTPWGPACYVTTPPPPTTKLSTGSCGITETSLEDYLYCDYVPGATDYRYEITDPNNNVTVYYRGNSSYAFLMSWMPGVGYGVTYSIRVAAAAGGTWTAYGPACNVTTPAPPTTKLSTGSCGITETSLEDYLYCDYVPGATDYKLEITDPNNNVTVYYRGNSSYVFLMSWVPGIAYGVTYSVRVAAAAGGTWTAYGPACNVTTPAPPTTKLSSGSCGITETSLEDYLYCDYVPGATDYKLEITDPNNNVTVYYRGNSSYVFLMSWVPGIAYGVTYSVRVAAAAGGTWTAYGPACNVTTPAPPTTKLSSGSCGITETDLQDYLYCDYVPGATDYRYEITDPNNNVTVYYRGNSSYVFLMSWLSGISYGVTYSIKVAAAVGGTWTAWGAACNVTTPAGPKAAPNSDTSALTTSIIDLDNGSNEPLLIQVFPNPTSGELQVNLGKNYENVEVVISNSLGQKVYIKNFNSAGKLTLDLEEPKGIYFLTVRSGENMSARLKIIKE